MPASGPLSMRVSNEEKGGREAAVRGSGDGGLSLEAFHARQLELLDRKRRRIERQVRRGGVCCLRGGTEECLEAEGQVSAWKVERKQQERYSSRCVEGQGGACSVWVVA